MWKRTVRCELEGEGGGNRGKEAAFWKCRQDRQVEKLAVGSRVPWELVLCACSEIGQTLLLGWSLESAPTSVSYNPISQISS